MVRQGRRILIVLVVALLLIGLSLLPGVFVERTGEDTIPPHAGRIRTLAGSPPPSSVRVQAWAEGLLGEAEVGGDGSFCFDALPESPREYEVSVSGSKFRVRAEPEPVEILVPGSLVPGFGAEGPPGEVDPVPETIEVGGVLVDADGKRPVTGAEVSFKDRSVRSGARGRFALGNIPTPEAGDPPVTVRAEGYRTVYVLPPADAGWDDLYLRLVRR